MRFEPIVLIAATLAACKGPDKAERLDLDLIAVSNRPSLRTSAIGGAPDPDEIRVRKRLAEPPILGAEGKTIIASYVLVDAENRSDKDAYVTLGGTLLGGDHTAPLRPESLYVPAAATRTFLLLDKGLAARPWATGVEVIVTGAVVARYPLAIAITDENQLEDGDHVVLAAGVEGTAKREGTAIIHCAFFAADGMPVSRAHSVIRLLPHQKQTVRFVGPPGSRRGTIFAGEAAFD